MLSHVPRFLLASGVGRFSRPCAFKTLLAIIAVSLDKLPLFQDFIEQFSVHIFKTRLRISPAVGTSEWFLFSLSPCSGVVFNQSLVRGELSQRIDEKV